ncbi:hypothetical protein ScPMuIL_003267 [Solemya velum]
MPRPKTGSDEKRMKMKAKENIKKTQDPVERLRLICMSRGAQGIRGLGKKFKIADDDGNKTLQYSEFKKGIIEYGIEFSEKDMKEIFERFDEDGSGSINFDEFLENLRPPMSAARVKIIEQAFQKLDKTGDEVITVEDIKGVYKVTNHPKFQNGEMDETQCLQEYLNTFDSKDKDGKVTKDEFIQYYNGVSASIDEDAYFDLMMRQAWDL